MNTRRHRSRFCFAAILAGVLVTLALFDASPALAHGKRGQAHRRKAVVVTRPVPPVHVVAPHRLTPLHVRLHRPYLAGQFYFAPHRHAHAVYRFPVATRFGVVHQSFVYCGDRLVIGARVPTGFFVDFSWSSADDRDRGYGHRGPATFERRYYGDRDYDD